MNFDNTNRGALFRNDGRQKETDADYRGTINIDGREFWLNAWIKQSKAGSKYISLSIRAKETSAQA